MGFEFPKPLGYKDRIIKRTREQLANKIMTDPENPSAKKKKENIEKVNAMLNDKKFAEEFFTDWKEMLGETASIEDQSDLLDFQEEELSKDFVEYIEHKLKNEGSR